MASMVAAKEMTPSAPAPGTSHPKPSCCDTVSMFGFVNTVATSTAVKLILVWWSLNTLAVTIGKEMGGITAQFPEYPMGTCAFYSDSAVGGPDTYWSSSPGAQDRPYSPHPLLFDDSNYFPYHTRYEVPYDGTPPYWRYENSRELQSRFVDRATGTYCETVHANDAKNEVERKCKREGHIQGRACMNYTEDYAAHELFYPELDRRRRMQRRMQRQLDDDAGGTNTVVPCNSTDCCECESECFDTRKVPSPEPINNYPPDAQFTWCHVKGGAGAGAMCGRADGSNIVIEDRRSPGKAWKTCGRYAIYDIVHHK